MENLISSNPVSTPLPTPTPDSVEPPLVTQPKPVVRKSKRKLAQSNAAALPKPRPIPVIKKAPRDPNAPKRKRGRPRKYDVNMVQPATIMTTSKLGENPAQMQKMQHMHMNAHLMGQQQQQNMMRQQHAMQVYQEQLRRHQQQSHMPHGMQGVPMQHQHQQRLYMQQQHQQLFQQRQQQKQQYRNPSNFVSDYFDFTAQSLKALDEHSGGSVHSLKSTGGTAPQHQPPVSTSGPVSVVAMGNPPAPAQPPLANPPNHLPHSGTSSSSFPSAVSTVRSYSTTDSATFPKENVPAALPAQPIIISKTEGIKYDTHVNSTTLPPPHILQKSIPPQHLPHANPSADPNTPDNTNPGHNNPAHSVASPLESLYRPRIITVGGKEPDYIPQQNDLNPQEWLDGRFEERGYSIENFSSLECAYYNKPTEFQQASYGLKVVNMCRTNDVEGLKEVMECGLSYNPCNQFGESLIHMACRRGNYELLKYLVDRGCSVQICDDFGRTPLHDACWTSEPNFKIVELLLDTDVRLLHVVDCRGATPLAYIKRENWHKWKEFFHSKVEIYWFTRDSESLGEEPPPALSLEAPCSRVLVDHDSPLGVGKAAELASGKISPQELKEEQSREQSEAKTDDSASVTGGGRRRGEPRPRQT
ncbi:hypothetical protein TL16_g01692 [Triparma laevis f. inornata]|uniref:Uncharacterized protein n=1 Tax=Triparma laevis f. inornata TaxID=1714386 RepID=A0A9W7DSE1_9STRA|nr:hypothetical protein TL16_g01692 [Triparma laevis f. inornata]